MAGLQSSIITFVSGTVIASGQVNANFSNINSDNVFSVGGVTIQNNDFYYAYDTGAVARPLIGILSADNDAHIRTTPAHGLLKITKSDASADIAQFNDTAGLQVFGGGTTGVEINTANASTPSYIKVGVAFGVKDKNNNPLMEVKSNGNLVAKGTIGTNGGTGSVQTGQSFDTFDYAEIYPCDAPYSGGTIVCPGEHDRLTRCTHDGCHAALIISPEPGMCLGMAQVSLEYGVLPVALVGRVNATCDPTHAIRPRQLLCSDGRGGVRALRRGESAYVLGFALNSSADGRVGLFIRPMFAHETRGAA